MIGTAVEELQDCTIDINVVVDSWTRIVPQWSSFVRHRDVHRRLLHGPALLNACGDVRGKRVLDLGCGEGWCSRALAARGAHVVAVDVCEAMITEARARQVQACEPVDYRVLDAADVGSRFTAESFDVATACMSLHDMPDPGRALRSARSVLAADGRLVCSIPHPMTHAEGGRRRPGTHDEADYFKCAPYRVRWNAAETEELWWTIRWSRTLSQYMDMLSHAGFVIHKLLEPRATAEQVEEDERLRRAGKLPYYLVIVAAPVPPGPGD